MLILAIDTALEAVSACVLEDGSDEPLSSETISMERGHAEALMPLLDRVIGQIEGDFQSIDRISVTVGPGSFTGLRVGIAAARAIAVACSIPVVGVSTLAVLAAPLIMDGQPGNVGIAIDARHGNVYFAAFNSNGQAFLSPRIVSVRDAVRSLGEGPVRLAGSGAGLLAVEAAAVGMQAEIVANSLIPDIVYVAKLGLFADPELASPRPLYLKSPDAKPPGSHSVALAMP